MRRKRKESYHCEEEEEEEYGLKIGIDLDDYFLKSFVDIWKVMESLLECNRYPKDHPQPRVGALPPPPGEVLEIFNWLDIRSLSSAGCVSRLWKEASER